MHSRIFSLIVILTFSFIVFNQDHARAQEVDCSIKVNYETVPTTNKDLLLNFESDLKEYVNRYKWGNDNLDEKIRCTFQINVKSVVGENRYSADIFVGSSRQVYGANKTSAMLRLFDESWEFTYVKSQPLTHNPYSFTDLASLLDFYVYLIIGYDYDSYIEMAGTQFFQKAADISNLGRSAGAKGWEPAKSGYSRLQLIDDILNSKFAPMRYASFKYHFAGLDSLAFSKTSAQANIAGAIEMIGDLKKSADPRNQVIRSWFDAKYQEIAENLVGYPDPKIYLDLSVMDPTHQQTYEEYRKRR